MTLNLNIEIIKNNKKLCEKSEEKNIYIEESNKK